jgi:AcrR family transcriptional regulator
MMLPVIMRAAAELFARFGFQQPTMDEVAIAAGVRKATLYIYFDSKAALISAVVDRWLQELPIASPVARDAPLRQQLIETGLQLQKLTAHPAAIALTKRLAEAEPCLTPKQLEAWQRRYVVYEDFLAGLLERHGRCEHPRRVAYQFLILAIGGVDFLPVGSPITDMSRVECAVELILRAYGKESAKGIE